MQTIKKTLLILVLTAIILCAWLTLFDLPATERVDAGLKRALISFTSARALNAIISVAQGTEIAAQPMGVGVTLTPGQLLDPINDLVEQFSSLMLIASVALGTQKVLLHMGSFWPVSVLLTIITLVWSVLYWQEKSRPKWLTKLLLLLLMVRFVIPIITLGSEMIFQQFLLEDYMEHQQALVAASAEVDAFIQHSEMKTPPQAAVEDPSFWQQSKQNIANLMTKTHAALDVKAHMEKLQIAAEAWTRHIINLIVIFLLQTLLIPLILVGVLYSMVINNTD